MSSVRVPLGPSSFTGKGVLVANPKGSSVG